MTREEAINEIKSWDFLEGKEIEAIHTLIPELSESEDEKILDTLIEHFEGFSPIKVFGDFDFTSKQILAYLEKLKETGIQWLKSDNVKNPDKPYIDKAGMFYTTDGRMCYASEIEKQKERGPLTKEEEYTLHRIIEYLEDETCPSEWISLLHDIYCLPYEKQKEQKPTEPSDDELQRHQGELYDFKVFAAKQAREHHISFAHDFEWNNFCGELLSYFNEKQKPFNVCEQCPYYKDCPDYNKHRDADDLQLLGFIYDLLNEIEWKNNWAMSKDECLRRLSNYRPQKPTDDKAFEEWIDDWYQGSKEAGGDIMMSEAEFKNWSRGIRNMYQQKPAEWSEEDRHAIENCEYAIKETFKDEQNPHRIGTLDWLKSLPGRFSLGPKQEWSDEDEKIRQSIIKDIEFEKNYTSATTGKVIEKYNEQINWLKFLSSNLKKRNEAAEKLCSNEWSEEDERMLSRCVKSIESSKQFADSDTFKKAKDNEVNWLENRFESIRPQPKAGLPRLDENIINAAIAFVEQNDHFNHWVGIDKHTVITALRSLKSSWKPSKEQMNALLYAMSFVSPATKESVLLSEIYENLKNWHDI